MTKAEVMALKTKEALRKLTLQDFSGRFITKEEFLHILKVFGGYFDAGYPPDPRKPHPLLTNGLHARELLVCSEVLYEPNLCEILSYFLSQANNLWLEEWRYFDEPVDWIIGVGYSAIPLVYGMQKFCDNPKPKVGFTTKDINGRPTIWNKRIEGKRVLLVNDVFTTKYGSTLQAKVGIGAISC